MVGRTISLPRPNTGFAEATPVSDEHEEFIEASDEQSHAVRGLVLAMALGAGIWAVILYSTGILKL